MKYWGSGVGLEVGLRLRHRLLWFWVFGWPRGVGMVRKWKWYMLTQVRPRPLHMNPHLDVGS